jgi:hypothetical protein
MAPTLIWEASSSEDNYAYFNAPGHNFHCWFARGNEPNTWRVSIDVSFKEGVLQGEDAGHLALPPNNTPVKLTIVDREDDHTRYPQWDGRVYHGQDSSSLVVIIRNPLGFHADNLVPGKKLCSLMFALANISLHKELDVISTLCRPELVLNPPPLTQVDPLALLCSQKTPGRRSRNFLVEFEDEFPGTEEQLDDVKAAIQDIRKPCENIPEHDWVYKTAVSGADEGTVIVQGCTGGGKTSLQDRIGLTLALLRNTVLFASKTNVAVDELMKRMIKLIDEIELPVFKDVILRLGSAGREANLDLNLESEVYHSVDIEEEEKLEDELPKELRFASLSERLEEYCAREPYLPEVQAYLTHRRGRATKENLRRPHATALSSRVL